MKDNILEYLRDNKRKKDAIKIADERTVKGKQSEWTIILKANGPQAPTTSLAPLKEKK